MRLSWLSLYRQFGTDPDKASDNVTVQNFRKDCLRELKKIKLAWTELNYSLGKGVLILSPSTPLISPKHLERREGASGERRVEFQPSRRRASTAGWHPPQQKKRTPS